MHYYAQVLVSHINGNNGSGAWWEDWIIEILEVIHLEDIFITKTVNELIWGYVDPVLDLAQYFKRTVDPKIG